MRGLPFLSITILLSGSAALLAAMGPTARLFEFSPLADASSALVEKGKPTGFYAADNVLDGRYETAWCVGKKGSPVGEWIRLQYRVPLKLDGTAWMLSVFNGYGRTRSLYYANNRIKDYSLEIIYSGEGRTIRHVLKGRLADDQCATAGQFGRFCAQAHGGEGAYLNFDYEVGGTDKSNRYVPRTGRTGVDPTQVA